MLLTNKLFHQHCHPDFKRVSCSLPCPQTCYVDETGLELWTLPLLPEFTDVCHHVQLLAGCFRAGKCHKNIVVVWEYGIETMGCRVKISGGLSWPLAGQWVA